MADAMLPHMLPRYAACLLFISIPWLFAAEEKPDVVMPTIKVTASRLERFGVLNQKLMDRAGQGTWRLLVWRVPTTSDSFSVFIGGAMIGDEIMSINGQDVSSIPKEDRLDMLRRDFKIVVKRAVGRRSFKLFALDGRGA